MRKVLISKSVMDKIANLRIYLTVELKLSHEAAHQRIDRIETFLFSLSNPINYPLCRFKKWKRLRYRCAVFERDWVFAYELFDEGVIVRDMSHTSLLKE